MQRIFASVAVAALLFSSLSFAQTKGGAAPVSQAASGMVDGEVRKVDKNARRITLKHGEIKQLDMAPMTMMFPVKDPAMLDKVKTGDKVKFKLQTVGGALTVTEIQAVK